MTGLPRASALAVLAPAFLLCGLGATASTARADAIDKMGGKLLNYEAEVKQIQQSVRTPKALARRDKDQAARRLINARVAFELGNYDDAAIMLYDLVETGAKSRDYDEALYYLAESLFLKKDYMGARNYFLRIYTELGQSSQFYQQAVERLVELSLKLKDDTDIDKYLTALDSIPASQRRASVPYVRGRYEYFSEKYDAALASFQDIAPESEYFIRAQYFAGASHIAKGELVEAAKIYEALVQRQSEDPKDKRVIELSHMALGRIHYERDQPSKAIDQYLMVSRKSDLFDETLYEIAWVYVKNKEYDKALRALELLALASPDSAMLPEVRILEGNLRIRKARVIFESGKGNALEEYDKAMDTFTVTRDQFEEARNFIEKVVAERKDPRLFVNQITGRTAETFDIEAQLPPIAVEWLREEPEVGRVIAVDTDLVSIRRDIETTEETIERLELAINSPSRVNIFPELADKRTRLQEIYEDTQATQTALAQEQWTLVSKHATDQERSEYEALRERRIRAARELDAMPNAKLSYGDRVTQARAGYAKLAARAAEIAVEIDAAEATLVAIDKYINDNSTDLTEAQKAEYQTTIEGLRTDIDQLREELAATRRDITLGKDQAGVGDESAVQTRRLQDEYREALAAEHAFVSGVTARMSGADKTRALQIGNLMDKGASVLGQIDLVNRAIDEVIDRELAEVRTALAEEKSRLATYREELQRYEAEAQQLGGEVLSSNFGKVSKRFYEVLIRADVGVIDVAWAAREQAEQTMKRLTLEESRERRVLIDQFGDSVNAPVMTDRNEKPDDAGKDGGGQ